MNMRLESDSIGTREIPADAYYGVQALRGAENFAITGQRMRPEFIISIAEIKKACAICNCEVGELTVAKRDAIIAACDEIIAGKLHDQFICDPIQGGAGTTANMNANEVIANRAIEILGGQKGDYSLVHPNDHVNRAQSTNDVIPTTAKLTAAKLLRNAIFQVTRLQNALEAKRVRVQDALQRIGGVDITVSEILGSEETLHYRNKSQFPVSLQGKAGFYRARSHDVIPTTAKLTAAKLLRNAIFQVTCLQNALEAKKKEFYNII
jgi:aspartate ammonia-lyase